MLTVSNLLKKSSWFLNWLEWYQSSQQSQEHTGPLAATCAFIPSEPDVKVRRLVFLPNNVNVSSSGTTEQQRHVANDPLESEINVGWPPLDYSLSLGGWRLQWQRCQNCLLFFLLSEKPITNRVSVAGNHHSKHVCICASIPARKDCAVWNITPPLKVFSPSYHVHSTVSSWSLQFCTLLRQWIYRV